MENTQFLHSGHKLNGRDLREWSTIHNLLIRLSPKQSDLIIKSLQQKQFTPSGDENTLYLIYTDEKGQHAREITLDEMIDIACELSYEKMKELAENLAQIPYYDIRSYSNSLATLTKHCKGYQQLLDAYSQTKYCKNVNEALEQCKKQTVRDETERASIPHKHSNFKR